MTGSGALLDAELPSSVLTTRRPLRVLTLTPFYPSVEDPTQGSFVSGPLTYMESLAVSQEVIAVEPFYREAAHATAENSADWLKYFCIPTNLGLPSSGEFLGARLMRRVVAKHRDRPFDLIHAHSVLPCGGAAMRLSRRLSVPFVVSVHGLDAFFTRQAGAVVSSWCERVAKDVYGSAKTVICVSKKVSEQVLCNVEANVSVVYNGADAELFSPDGREHLPLTVLSIGNLIPVKGHTVLLHAFARVSAELPDCRLEIIGDGPMRSSLAELARELQVSDRVNFRGRQSRRETAQAMRRCSVFALPSEYEALGCVYLEAMACGKTVIGCRGQGIDEVVEHGKTGMLIPPGDGVALFDSLLILLRNAELRRRMGASARQVVLQKLTLQHQAERLCEIYRRSVA